METKDEYPSRMGGEYRIIERKDPVVYGDRTLTNGPLTAAQLDQYERDGYLMVEGLFSPEEVEVFRNELDILRSDEAVKKSDCVFTEATSGDIRSVFNVTRLSQVYFTLSRDPRILDAAKQILDDNVYFHQTRVNFKPGFEGKDFYWHSDFETWHVEDGMPRMRCLSCSVLLTPNTNHNGSLMLVPGSHRYFVSCAGSTPEDHYKSSLRRQEHGLPDTESMEFLVEQGGIDMPVGPAGSVLFFDCNTMHGSNSNISPQPRSNVFFVFNAVSNAVVAPFSGMKPRPDYIAARDDFTPISPVSVEPSYSALQTA